MDTQQHSQRTAREQGEKARKLHSTRRRRRRQRESEAEAEAERSARAAELQAASAWVFLGPRECGDEEEQAAAQRSTKKRAEAEKATVTRAEIAGSWRAKKAQQKDKSSS